MKVHEAWACVMADVQGVRKGDKNTQQNYSFRGIDAVMNAVGPALRAHGVAVVPSLRSHRTRDITVGGKGTPMREVTVEVEFTVIGPEGDTFSGVTPGEAMDSGDKATPKAMSVALRTFLLQALCIPTDEPDPDMHSYERAAPPAPAPADPRVAKLDAEARALDAEDRAILTAERVGRGWPGRIAEYTPDQLDELERVLDEIKANRNGG